MNILALYDIHGNVDALEAVLADAPDPDVILVGGDVVPGPFAAAVLDRLEGARWIRGNGEREAAADADDERVRALGDLPLTLEIDGVLYCHATPRSDDEMLTRISPPERYADALAGVEARIVVAGHTHQQDDRFFEEHAAA